MLCDCEYVITLSVRKYSILAYRNTADMVLVNLTYFQ